MEFIGNSLRPGFDLLVRGQIVPCVSSPVHPGAAICCSRSSHHHQILEGSQLWRSPERCHLRGRSHLCLLVGAFEPYCAGKRGRNREECRQSRTQLESCASRPAASERSEWSEMQSLWGSQGSAAGTTTAALLHVLLLLLVLINF